MMTNTVSQKLIPKPDESGAPTDFSRPFSFRAMIARGFQPRLKPGLCSHGPSGRGITEERGVCLASAKGTGAVARSVSSWRKD
jgi:hypothetical protein